jgi:hypothetical protein
VDYHNSINGSFWYCWLHRGYNKPLHFNCSNISNRCKSDPCVRKHYYISVSELGLELNPELLNSTLRVWRTLHTEGMYPYHIQRIKHLEPVGMCSRLELCRWINSNPHTVWFVTFFHRRGPRKVNAREELLQLILSAARSSNNAAVLRKVTCSLDRKGIQADGEHFEQLVWTFNDESVSVHLTTHRNKCTMLLFIF